MAGALRENVAGPGVTGTNPPSEKSVIDRVRHPNTPPKDRDLGPAHAQRQSKLARLPIDEAIVYAATHGHYIRASAR